MRKNETNTNNVTEMDLQTRKMIANGVIKNAKEIISVGLHGKETKKIIALVPVSLIKVDHQSYQREEKKHVINILFDSSIVLKGPKVLPIEDIDFLDCKNVDKLVELDKDNIKEYIHNLYGSQRTHRLHYKYI